MFNAGQSDEPDEPVETTTESSRITISQQVNEAKEKANADMLWFNIIDTLAQGDVLKYDAVSNINLTIAMNKLVLDKSLEHSYTNRMMQINFE